MPPAMPPLPLRGVPKGSRTSRSEGEYVHRFGGSDDDDSSGVLRYVSIRHGGQKLSPDKEINGVSFCGVGRGTVVENVEVLSFADDDEILRRVGQHEVLG